MANIPMPQPKKVTVYSLAFMFNDSSAIRINRVYYSSRIKRDEVYSDIVKQMSNPDAQFVTCGNGFIRKNIIDMVEKESYQKDAEAANFDMVAENEIDLY